MTDTLDSPSPHEIAAFESRILEAHQRRFDERERMLNTRLDTVEREHAAIRVSMASIESKVGINNLETTHLKDLFDARFRVIEKGQEIHITKFDALSQQIVDMASNPDKTPAGRTVKGYIETIAQTCDAHTVRLTEIGTWQSNVNGVIATIKWIGFGSAITAIVFVIKALLSR